GVIGNWPTSPRTPSVPKYFFAISAPFKLGLHCKAARLHEPAVYKVFRSCGQGWPQSAIVMYKAIFRHQFAISGR
ncbi:MAG: hypothetical protein KA993_05410, partial [Neisseria sp.]|nr:hypothetical protein [Neisseria sp.]